MVFSSPGCGLLVQSKLLKPRRTSCTLLSEITLFQMPTRFVAFFVWIDEFDGCPPADSTNGFSQSHRDPRIVNRSFPESWSSTRASTLFCVFLYGSSNVTGFCPVI